jgi:phosphoglycerate dehydrogenase-like enzyme
MEFVCMLSAAYERNFVQDDLKKVMAAFGRYTHLPWAADKPPSDEEMLAVLRNTDVLLTGWESPRLPLSYLEQPERRLRYICNLTGSIQAMIPRAYAEKGVVVTNWGDGPMWYLAEGNLALILACTREMPRLRRHMLERPQWTYPYAAPRPTLRRKTVGFVGFGAIAGVLYTLLKPFDCAILVYDPYAADLPPDAQRAPTLRDLFARSDVLTVQCGLSKETIGMLDRPLLDLLPPHAIFINTARGKIVVEKDLIAFLRARPDVFAGLDVYEQEPLPTDSPLLQMDNVICYPHSVGGGGEATYAAASEFAAANIRAFCTGGKLKAVITPEKYDRMT